jgi:hypothetical protein
MYWMFMSVEIAVIGAWVVPLVLLARAIAPGGALARLDHRGVGPRVHARPHTAAGRPRLAYGFTSTMDTRACLPP